MEKRKFKLSIQPKIKYDSATGGRSGLNEMTIPFINHGETAYHVVVSPNNLDHSPIKVLNQLIPELNKNETFNVVFRTEVMPPTDKPYDFDITFSDAEKNKYKVTVRGKGLMCGTNPMIEVAE